MGLWRATNRRAIPAHTASRILRSHCQHWKALTPQQRAKYDARASLASASSSSQIEAEKEDITEHIGLLRQRIVEASARRGPLVMSACALDEQAMDALEALFESGSFSAQRVRELRGEAQRAPPLPTARQREKLDAIPVWSGEPAGKEKPKWLSLVCRNREAFADAALSFNSSSGKQYFKFLYATQSPYQVCCSPLEKEEYFEPPPSDEFVSAADVFARSWEHRFQVSFMRCVYWADLPDVGTDEVYVLPDCCYREGRSVCSDADEIELEAFVRGLDAKPKASERFPEERPPKVGRKAANAELLDKYPWLEAHFDATEKPSPGLGSAGFASDEGPVELAPERDLSDEEIERVFKLLHDKRVEDDMVEKAELADFRYALLGGSWTMKNRGKAFDAWRGAVRGKDAEAWCDALKLNHSARFEVTLYTERGAALLAKTWCHRMQFLYDLHLASRKDEVVYTEENLAPWEPSKELGYIIETLPEKAQKRVRGVLGLRP